MALEIVDTGRSFNPLEQPDVDTHLPLEQRAGGFGIYLVRSLMDEVEYTRQGDENVLGMKKKR